MEERVKLPCAVAEDLLPLYHDMVCSEESRALVEEHLAACGHCREVLSRMDYDVVSPSSADEMKPLVGLRSAWLRLRKKALLKGVIATAAAVSCLVGALFVMNDWKFIPVPTAKMELTEHSVLPDGTVAFHLLVDDGLEIRHIAIDRDYEAGVVYLTPKRSILEARTPTPGEYYSLNDRVFFIEWLPFTKEQAMDPAYEEEIAAYQAALGDWYMSDFSLPADIRKVCLGTEKDHIVLWEEGMVLPAASEELEAFFRSANR